MRKSCRDKGEIKNNPIEIQSDSEVGAISVPRKKVKKCQEKLNCREYSKIPQVPEVRLTKEDMEGDPIKLLIMLQKKYEEFGAVKIVAAPEWRPPFCFRFTDRGITTRIQHLHKLKHGKSFKQKQEAYNVGSFKDLAQNFEKNYRFKCSQNQENQSNREQEEYWNLVNGNYVGPEWKFKTSVEYAADLQVKKHGSGFPISQNRKTKDQNFDYYKSYFNLNNLYKSPSSILKIVDQKKEYISGVTTPWVYMGMMFSTFCWHVEDLWLNSLNYSHTGDTKTWYIIPKSHKEKFDAYVQKKTGRTDLLNRITFMLDPLEIMSQGIPVYKANQRPGEYVCTFYKAYHGGFSHGFNVGEAVNFASPISLNYIKTAMKSYEKDEKKGPSVLSLEWLVYENKIKKNNFDEMNAIIAQEYQQIIKKQLKSIQELNKKYKLKPGLQISSSCKYDRNSCSKCHNYQYLSSIKCTNCGKNYCFSDAQDCCNSAFQLILRQPNEDRKKILSICKFK